MATPAKYLLDTGILIRELRGDSRAAALMDRLSALGDLLASPITAFEIYRGCRTLEEERATTDLFERVHPLDITHEIARRAARLMREHPGIFSSERAAADALIAGAAITSQAVLVTLNTRQFARQTIQGLATLTLDQQAQDWTASVP